MGANKLLSYLSLDRTTVLRRITRTGGPRFGVWQLGCACVLLCSLKIEYDAYRQIKPLSCVLYLLRKRGVRQPQIMIPKVMPAEAMKRESNKP